MSEKIDTIYYSQKENSIKHSILHVMKSIVQHFVQMNQLSDE